MSAGPSNRPAFWLGNPFALDAKDRTQLCLTRIPLVVILTAMVVLERLDVALTGVHEPGATSGGMGDIATPARLLSADVGVAIADGWATLPEAATPLVRTYGVIDLVLMLTLSFWLMVLHYRRLALVVPDPDAGAAPWRYPFYWVVGGYLLADGIETSTLVGSWNALDEGTVLVIAGASLAKWLMLGVAVLLLVLLYRLPTQAVPQRISLRRAILATRGQLLVVVVLVGVLLMLQGDLGRQVDEVLALAATRPLAAAAATAGSVLAMMVLAWGGLACLHAYLAPRDLPIASESQPSGMQARLLVQAPPPDPATGQDAETLIAVSLERVRRRHACLGAATGAVVVMLLVVARFVADDVSAAALTWTIPFGLVTLALLPALIVRPKSSTRHWYVAEPGPDPADPPSPDAAEPTRSDAPEGNAVEPEPGADPAPSDAVAPSLLAAPEPVPVTASVQEVVGGREWVVLVLADVPMLAIFLAIARSATTSWTAGAVPWPQLWWALVVAPVWLLLHASLLSWAGVPEHWNSDDYEGKLRLATLGTGVPLLALAAFGPLIGNNWVPFYQALGTPAILMLFAVIMALLLTGLTLLGDALRPGGMLEAFGVTRVPIFTLVLIWGLLASSVDSVGAYYVVWTSGTVPDRQPITEALTSWLGSEPQSKPPVRSLVFVAAAGGGIRAAYWTRLGMDCLFGTDCGNPADHTGEVFLASGVSGGSLGLVSTRSRQQASNAGEGHGIDTVLGDDFIAPALAAFLLHDQANGFLRLPLPGGNRADVLEQAWEAADSGLATPFGSTTLFPRLILNSTSVEDGCRLDVSELDFTPAPPGNLTPAPPGTGRDQRSCSGPVEGLGPLPSPSPSGSAIPSPTPSASPDADGPKLPPAPGSMPTRDALAHLCENGQSRGLALSTAALLSARFPYVSPAGGLRGCEKKTKRTFALDGGIVDNSGATAVLEAWQAVSAQVAGQNKPGATCVVPRLVVLDATRSAAVPTEADDRPPQLTAPLVSALGGFDRRSSTPVAEAAGVIRAAAEQALIECGLADRAKAEAENSVIVIAPHEQPGPGLPLGWTLSNETRTQMRCQLFAAKLAGTETVKSVCNERFLRDNQAGVETVQSWFRS
jgi:hypothetical protein